MLEEGVLGQCPGSPLRRKYGSAITSMDKGDKVNPTDSGKRHRGVTLIDRQWCDGSATGGPPPVETEYPRKVHYTRQQ